LSPKLYRLFIGVKEVFVEVEASFGHWLQRRRKALDLTQEELAQRVGCAAETLRKIEADARRPSRQIAERLAEALQIPEADRALFIKAARSELAVDRLTPPTQDISQVALVPARTASSEAVSFLFTQITPAFQTKSFDGRCPYKGLDVFEEEDADLFFGRERLVEELVRRVETSRAMFVIGPSGSGKSSLMRAGLIHALKQGAIESLHSERWLYETLNPGRDPMAELARVISSLAGTTRAGEELRESAPTDPGILGQWCEIALKEGRQKRVILFIDQFEEIFTQLNDEEERVTFLNSLIQAATTEDGRVIVLFAMRSDFVMNCATYPKLNALFNRQSIQIGAMEPDELANAIAQPALRVGLRIDRELVKEIIEDMEGEPGALPLMQFALKDQFDSQQGKGGGIDLTLDDYRQHGGLHRSLGRHADDSFARLQADEQELARSIFSGLIEIGSGTQDTRRTALLDELIPADSKAADVKVVIQKLANARLITTDEKAGEDTVTISHEKLIDAWPWLKKLVNENREVIALQNEIVDDAKEWEEHNRDTSYLYRGARLASAREQLQARKLVLSSAAREFIESGVHIFADELEASRQRATQLRRRSVYLSIAFAAALIAAGVALFYSSQARQQANIALARQIAAQAQKINAARNSKQMIAVLLAVQSMKLFPSTEAAQILLNNAGSHLVTSIDHASGFPVAFSPDSRYIVSGAYEENAFTTRVWEATTGKEMARITIGSVIRVAVFSPDGNYVVTSACDLVAYPCVRSTTRVWEPSTEKEVSHISQDGQVVTSAFSPDGKYVVSGGEDGTARVWEALTGKEIARMIDTHNTAVPILPVAFSPDGKYVISGGQDGTARVWEAMTGKEIARMTHDIGVWSVAFSPDGKYVISGGVDGTARVWEAMTGKEIARMTHDNSVSSVAFSPDSKYVMSGSGDGTARMWETMSGWEVARMTHEDSVSSAAFSPNGKFAASTGMDSTVRVWAVPDRPEISAPARYEFSMAELFNKPVPSPDGKWIVSFKSKDRKTVSVSAAATGKEMAQLKHDDQVNSIAFSRNGKYIVTGSSDGTARVWEAATGRELSRVHCRRIEGNTVAFHPDGNYAAVGCSDGTIRVWDIFTGKELISIKGPTNPLVVSFSSDGKYIASGGLDQTARVWDVKTGEQIAHMTHDEGVSSLAFSPGGKYVISGSYDGTVILWEAHSGNEVARRTRNRQVSPLAFTSDGKYVVAGSDPGTADIWLWRPEDLIADACSRSPRNLTLEEWIRYLGTTPYEVTCSNLMADHLPHGLRFIQVRSYSLFVIAWAAVVYSLGGWLAYRTVFSPPRAHSPSALGSTWKHFVIAAGQGGLLLFLFTAGVQIFLTFVVLQSALSPYKGMAPPPYLNLLLIPLGLWAGVAYSHFTRDQSGKRMEVKRILLSSLAGFISLLLSQGLLLSVIMIRISGDAVADNFWNQFILGAGRMGIVGAVLSALGAFLYILISRRRMRCEVGDGHLAGTDLRP
jgi:WD40 repeat protein/transcriptional regulator with XRE-family HTH domain